MREERGITIAKRSINFDRPITHPKNALVAILFFLKNVYFEHSTLIPLFEVYLVYEPFFPSVGLMVGQLVGRFVIIS